MSALSDQAGDYLRLRRALGHNLDQAHRLLPDFVAYLDAIGAQTVTVEAALVWAQRPDARPRHLGVGAADDCGPRLRLPHDWRQPGHRDPAAGTGQVPGSAGARRSSTPPLTSPR